MDDAGEFEAQYTIRSSTLACVMAGIFSEFISPNEWPWIAAGTHVLGSAKPDTVQRVSQTCAALEGRYKC